MVTTMAKEKEMTKKKGKGWYFTAPTIGDCKHPNMKRKKQGMLEVNYCPDCEFHFWPKDKAVNKETDMTKEEKLEKQGEELLNFAEKVDFKFVPDEAVGMVKEIIKAAERRGHKEGEEERMEALKGLLPADLRLRNKITAEYLLNVIWPAVEEKERVKKRDTDKGRLEMTEKAFKKRFKW